jgi:hypothetical protein
MCPGEDCRVNKSGGRLHLQTRGSKFVKFQASDFLILKKKLASAYISPFQHANNAYLVKFTQQH